MTRPVLANSVLANSVLSAVTDVEADAGMKR